MPEPAANLGYGPDSEEDDYYPEVNSWQILYKCLTLYVQLAITDESHRTGLGV